MNLIVNLRRSIGLSAAALALACRAAQAVRLLRSRRSTWRWKRVVLLLSGSSATRSICDHQFSMMIMCA
jgi:hypothetical protein